MNLPTPVFPAPPPAPTSDWPDSIRELCRTKVQEAIELSHAWIAGETNRQIGLISLGLIAFHRRLFPFAHEAFERAGSEASFQIAPHEVAFSSVLSGATPVEKWRTKVPQTLFDQLSLAAGALPHLPLEIPNSRQAHLLGILGFNSPDEANASRNLGDAMQAAALLSLVAGVPGVRFSGDPGLVKLANTLRSSQAAESNLCLIPVERDLLAAQSVEKPIWLPVFGKSCDRWFGGRFAFPFPANVRPLFVGFHLANPALLTTETIAYFKAYEPIGCRDWNSVFCFLRVGVDAFLSGSISLAGRLPTLAPARRRGEQVWVDLLPPVELPTAKKLSQIQKTFPALSLAERLEAALARREKLGTFETVTTSRLECYLNCLAAGVRVNFQPKNPTDRRFEGVTNVSPEELKNLGNEVADCLISSFTQIAEGASEACIRAQWGEHWRTAVENAKARLFRAKKPLNLPFSPQQLSQAALSHSLCLNPGTDPKVELAMAADAHYKSLLPIVLRSVLDHCSQPCRLWLLCRSVAPEEMQELAALFPEIEIHFLPCDAMDYGPIVGMLPHLSVATMDRLMLPRLLPEISKVLYLDLDIIVLGDLAELFSLELGSHPFAGRPSLLNDHWFGHHLIDRAAKRFDAMRAAELRERMHALHDLRFQSVNAGVLLMNLERMREDRFCEEFIPFAEHFGMYDQEILNCYAGPNRVELGAEWNALPAQGFVEDAKIIHWAGRMKPWKCEVPGRAHWLMYCRRVGSNSTIHE